MKKSVIDGFGAELRRLLADVESLLQEGADAAGERLDAARTGTRESLQRAQEHLRAAEQEITSGARRVNATVRAHPWESLAVVGVAAFLLGTLVRRR